MKNQALQESSTSYPQPDNIPYPVLSLILENIEERFLLVDRQLKIIAFNESSRRDIEKLIGSPAFPGMDLMAIVKPERRQFVLDLYNSVFQGNDMKSDTEYELEDGKKVQYRNAYRPARDHEGNVVGAIVTVTDVTAQMEKEQQLKDAEKRWQSAMETANQGVWDWDLVSDQIIWSNNYQTLLGLDKHQLGSSMKDWLKRVHPDDRGRLAEHVDDHTSSKDYYHELSYRVMDGKGRWRWILGRAMILSRDEHGKSLRMIGTHSDISEWVNKEQELRQSNERFTIASRASEEGLWEWDVEQDHVYVNETYTEIFGWTVDKDRRFDEWHEYIHPEDRDETIKDYYNTIGDPRKDYWKKEYRYLKSDGSYATISDKAAILRNQDGKAIKVIGSSQDITNQKMIESMLKRSNERFKIVSRVTSDVIYDWNLETNSLYWGEGLPTLFGWDPEGFTIDKWQECIHPSERAQIHETLNRAIDQREVNWEKEYRFRTADGHYRYVLDKAFIMRDDAGQARRLIGSMQDMTDRKLAEELVALERSVFAMSSDPRFSLNQVVESMILNLEQLLGSVHGVSFLIRDDETIEPLAAPSLSPELLNGLKGASVTHLTGSCGDAIRNKRPSYSGNLDDAIWSGLGSKLKALNLRAGWSIPVVLSNGQARGCFTLFSEEERLPTEKEISILERVRNLLRVLIEHSWAQNEIRLNNERFDAIVKATHDLIWDWEISRDKIYRDALGVEKVYGVSNPAGISLVKNFIARVHPEDQEKLRELIDMIMSSRTQNVFEIEYRFLRDDGSYSYVYDRGILFRDAAGYPVRMIGAAQDITERKHLEQELLRNELEKQRAINQATVDSQEQERGEIGKELHDNVNQVLTTTKLYLDLAMTNPEMTRDLLVKSVQNVTSVINEIRQLSRSLMDPTIGDLGFLDSTRELIDSINLTRQLTVKLIADRKLEESMNDSQKLALFRIIQEALNNTLKHARASNVQISLRLEKQHIVMLLVDDGIGYDASQIRRGAGLKNIQNRVYLIDGVHKFESAPGRGCRIIIRFPIQNHTQA